MGRQADCDLLIDEPNASRHHAEIRPDGDGYLLTDLGSTNGTKVNDTLIDRYRLRDGDVVTIGSRHMRFEAL
jgi:pSer/pThr/pTyr-binding forkhead associated (FHA) protein